MTPATWSALLLLAAGLVHSFSLMCRKLPPKRHPAVYPAGPLGRGAIDLAWIVLLLAGIRLAFSLSPWLGILGAIIYFVVLPFVFQPSLARMMGFRNLRDYLDTVDREKVP
jgi:hypothetical protein